MSKAVKALIAGGYTPGQASVLVKQLSNKKEGKTSGGNGNQSAEVNAK